MLAFARRLVPVAAPLALLLLVGGCCASRGHERGSDHASLLANAPGITVETWVSGHHAYGIAAQARSQPNAQVCWTDHGAQAISCLGVDEPASTPVTVIENAAAPYPTGLVFFQPPGQPLRVVWADSGNGALSQLFAKNADGSGTKQLLAQDVAASARVWSVAYDPVTETIIFGSDTPSNGLYSVPANSGPLQTKTAVLTFDGAGALAVVFDGATRQVYFMNGVELHRCDYDNCVATDAALLTVTGASGASCTPRTVNSMVLDEQTRVLYWSAWCSGFSSIFRASAADPAATVEIIVDSTTLGTVHNYVGVSIHYNYQGLGETVLLATNPGNEAEGKPIHRIRGVEQGSPPGNPCVQGPVIDNSNGTSSDCAGAFHTASCVVRCNAGYSWALANPTCDNGTWVQADVACQPVACPSLEAVAGGSWQITGSGVTGAAATLTCDAAGHGLAIADVFLSVAAPTAPLEVDCVGIDNGLSIWLRPDGAGGVDLDALRCVGSPVASLELVGANAAIAFGSPARALIYELRDGVLAVQGELLVNGRPVVTSDPTVLLSGAALDAPTACSDMDERASALEAELRQVKDELKQLKTLLLGRE